MSTYRIFVINCSRGTFNAVFTAIVPIGTKYYSERIGIIPIRRYTTS